MRYKKTWKVEDAPEHYIEFWGIGITSIQMDVGTYGLVQRQIGKLAFRRRSV